MYKIGAYQVCYNQEGAEAIDPDFIRYYNYRKDQFFENSVILDIYASHRHLLFDYVGVLSWRFRQKTGHTGREIIDAVNREPGYDVYNLLPRSCCYDPVHPYSRQAVRCVMDLAMMVDERRILPFDLLRYDTGGLAVWCNFWLIKSDLLSLYVEKYLRPLVNYFRNPDKEMYDFITKPLSEFNINRRHRDGIDYTVIPFFLEGLFSVFCHREKLNVKTIGPA
jgi:hypothetical protein